MFIVGGEKILRKYPFTKQQSNKDCGVAALQMIIKYYKGYIELEELRGMSKTNKNGTTAYCLIEAAKKVGFEAYGVKCKFEDITNDNLMLPAIAHVNIENKYQHFVVIYEVNFKKKYFVIADPANKIMRMSFNDFKLIWNQSLIFFYPIERIPFNYNKFKMSDFIINLIIKNKKRLFKILLLSLIVTFFSIVISFYFKILIDYVIVINNKSRLNLIFFVFLSLTLTKIITIYLRNKLLILSDKIISSQLSNSIFTKIASLPYHYYSNRTAGEIISYFDSATNVKDIIVSSLILFFIDLPLAVSSYVIVYIINKDVAFLILIIVLINLFAISFLYRVIRGKINLNQKKKAQITSYIVDTISGFETIKGINLSKTRISFFKKKYNDFILELYSLDSIQNIQIIINETLKQVSELLIIFIGCLYIIDSRMSIGQLVAINSLYLYIFSPLHNLPNILNEYSNSSLSLLKLSELFYYEKKEQPFNIVPSGNINICNLNFSYDGFNDNLKDINLNINGGEKVMLIGSSGSGKSTLLKLLMKYYQTNNEKIMINNEDINNYSEATYYDYVSYISQNEIIFNGTFYENLMIGSENDNDLLQVAKLCFVNEIINNNLGYNTLIEENGFNLSGGERQRVILARTLLKKFNILFIDEGLSQMDNDLERRILKNVFNRYKNQTIIITSHRLDNMDLFDKVIKMDKGKIIDIVVRHGY